jgi:hypothetical protein
MIGLHDIDRLAGGRLGPRRALPGLRPRQEIAPEPAAAGSEGVEDRAGQKSRDAGEREAERREAKPRRATLARC